MVLKQIAAACAFCYSEDIEEEYNQLINAKDASECT